MKLSRRWTVAPDQPDAEALANQIGTSALVARLLLNRGQIEANACAEFLRPSLKLLHEPALIPGLTVAAERLARAVREREKIVLYGDYDVDGITAVSILWHALRLLGGDVSYYVPHRVEEGYGLNAAALATLCDEGARVIVTVDCGVTALEPAKVAKARGVDLVISDHHDWKTAADGTPLLPDCHAIVHPRLPMAGPAYPNGNLCGAGVAFKLAWGVGQVFAGGGKVGDKLKGFLMEAMAFAALGTIADVVPLVGENRVLAHFGLGGLKQSRLNGIQALIESAKLTEKKLDSYHVGFLLAPRLNASGRMGHAALAVEMMTDATPERALEIAEYLDAQNRSRQQTERDIVAAALEQVEKYGYATNGSRAIVVGDAGWHPGVIGIVASRLVDRYHLPTVVIALGEDVGQGSGRSIDGFHLAEAFDACTSHLISHGGHEMAAGLKVKPEHFEAFRQAFLAHADATLTPHLLVPELRLDADAELRHMTETLVRDLKRLGPFGRGNPKPLLRCKGVTIASPPRRVGKTGDHLQLFVKQGSQQMKGIAFNAGVHFDRLQPGVTVHLAVEPQLNEWNGRVSVELEVKDLQIED